MDFFDDVVTKAKEAFDIASKKTGEVVTTQKQKIDILSLENKRDKDFEKLGAIYFDMIKDTEIEDAVVAELVSAVKEKNEKIENLKEEINNTKNKRVCPSCGVAVDKNANYCNACGEKLTFTSED